MSQNEPRAPLLRLMRYAIRYRSRIWLASACSVLNRVFDLAPPVLIGAAIDVVVEQQDSVIARFGYPAVESQLWILAGLTIIVWGLESLFQYAYSVLWRTLAQQLQHELRLDAYRHIQGHIKQEFL